MVSSKKLAAKVSIKSEKVQLQASFCKVSLWHVTHYIIYDTYANAGIVELSYLCTLKNKT